MKTFSQLTPAQQAKALTHFTNKLLRDICEGNIRFNDKLNHDTLQARIDKAINEADKMRTPWFMGEYIMDACKDDLESMASCDAENALYSERDECVVRGIAD